MPPGSGWISSRAKNRTCSGKARGATTMRGNDYNDWLNADTLIFEGWPKLGGAIPQEVFATAFFAHSTELVAKMAVALDRHDDAEHYRRLFDRIKAEFNRAYVKDDGEIQGDTQAGYALALHFDLLPDAGTRQGVHAHAGWFCAVPRSLVDRNSIDSPAATRVDSWRPLG
ncbi:MAG: hypothetical protein DMG58_32415 [Acidobacteria bacterium]|nr:MAG: hypothetical protein DMG58_32415 [Acidobacteriota bacterium]